MEAALVGFGRRMMRCENDGERLHREGKRIKKGTRIKRITLKTEWYKKSQTGRRDTK